jgi:hypothetical protein
VIEPIIGWESALKILNVVRDGPFWDWLKILGRIDIAKPSIHRGKLGISPKNTRKTAFFPTLAFDISVNLSYLKTEKGLAQGSIGDLCGAQNFFRASTSSKVAKHLHINSKNTEKNSSCGQPFSSIESFIFMIFSGGQWCTNLKLGSLGIT